MPIENPDTNTDHQPDGGREPDALQGDIDNPAMNPDLDRGGIDKDIGESDEIERKEPDEDGECKQVD